MIDVRPFEGPRRFRSAWLDGRRHFSFRQYRDAARVGLGRLRVWHG